MKKITIISSSLRNNSNSEILAKEFAKGASKNGNLVKFISLKDHKLDYCIGCMSCQKTKKCFMKDDANYIADELESSDIVVLATPVYYYSISGQLKTMIDRLNSLYSRPIKFSEVIALLVAAEDEEYTKEGALKAINGWVECLEGVKFDRYLFIGNLNEPKDILKDKRLTKAYELGLSI